MTVLKQLKEYNNMDIIVRSVLNYIQKQDTSKNAILAGGAVRDAIWGLTPNDYDICIPNEKSGFVKYIAQKLAEEFAITDMKSKTKEYEATNNKVNAVYTFNHEGLKFDLIGYKLPDDEEFPDAVINLFDFGMNMVYHNGAYESRDNEYFQDDLDRATMSLVNLKGMGDLPNAIHRYEAFNARTGGFLKFRAPCLKFKDEKKGELDWGGLKPKKKNVYGQPAALGQVAAAWAAAIDAPPPPAAAQAVGFNWAEANDPVNEVPELDNNF